MTYARWPFSWGAVLALTLAGCPAPPAGSDAGTTCRTARDCDDGLWCNGDETCAPGAPGADALGCLVGAAPCNASVRCDESADRCGDGCVDQDGDGVPAAACGGSDCDDADPQRFPGHAESCDATHDEDCDPSTVGARDGDGDGYVATACCNGTTCGDDCDDTNAGVHPTEAETCDGTDNDCDRSVDETVLHTYYVDADGDQHGVPGTTTMGCTQLPHTAEVVGDCDDTDPSRYEGAIEACDGVDNDCDETIDENGDATWYLDHDGDGFGLDATTMRGCARPTGYAPAGGDCDDARAAVFPGATEICDGRDDDCDGMLDGPGEDGDHDGFASLACAGTDCDDANAARYPGAPDVCDGLDDDCDLGTAASDDRDGDGHLPVGATCSGGPLAGAPRDDCDETNRLRFGGQVESCNGVDDDCDSVVDGAPATAWCNEPGRSPHAVATCVASSCALACNAPYLDCSPSAAGCETDGHQPASCGSCSLACETGALCPGGTCIPRRAWATSTTVTATAGLTTTAVRALASGACHVGGTFSGRLDVGASSVPSAGAADAFHFALGATGAPVFARASGTTLADEGVALGLGASGDVALVGALGSTSPAGTSGLVEPRDTTGASRFRATIGAGAATRFSHVVARPGGGYYVVGTFRGPITVGTTSYPGVANADTGLLVALGSTGAVVWSRTLGTGPAFWNSDAIGVGVDASGNVYTGLFFGDRPNAASIASYDSAGALRWSFFDTDDGSDGYLPHFLVGRSSGFCTFGYGYGTITTGGVPIAFPSTSGLLVCYDASGAHVAHRMLLDEYDARALDADGDTLLLAGALFGDADFGTGLLHGAYLLRLHADLSTDWTWQPEGVPESASVRTGGACYAWQPSSSSVTVVSLTE